MGSEVWGRSPRPGEAPSPAEVGLQFVPRRFFARAGALGGTYVLVLPYVFGPTVRIGRGL
ncbi:MAG: hypothetical protein H0V74_03190 [Chloroflexi bacterium]|nr:hypothetical protein [Chloroflexota bacterium]